MEEIRKLLQHIPETPSFLLFSGGLDSCAVLGTAKEEGRDVTPVWVDNGFNRANEKEVRAQAEKLGVAKLEVLRIAPNRKVCDNPPERCFYCKSQFLKSLSGSGKTLLDGTTTSDLGAYRPGLQALQKYNVISPIAEAGLTKKQAGELALAYGADARLAGMESCLATRFKYHEVLSQEALKAVRRIERFIIQETSDYDVRCRVDGEEHMRIEVKKPETYMRFAEEDFRRQIIEHARNTTLFVTMDLKPSRPNEYDKYLKKQ